MFKVLYSIIFSAKLKYTVTIWSPYQQRQKNEVENVQRSTMKIIDSFKGKNYEQRIIELDLMTTEERRKHGGMNDML